MTPDTARKVESRMWRRVYLLVRARVVYLLLLTFALPACTETHRPLRLSASSGSVRIEWAEIPAGLFAMGEEQGDEDEEPIHPVHLDAYRITRYEITFADYLSCIRADACTTPAIGSPLAARQPVVGVSWMQAQDFCRWLGGRLPTEAEWERAARGGLEGARYPWGDEEPVCERELPNGAQFGYCRGALLPVGSFQANGFGLFDLAGNAWEWVADWYDPDYYQSTPSKNPTGPTHGEYKVIRGGSWNYSIYGLRVAYRSLSYPSSQANFIGFRCAAD